MCYKNESQLKAADKLEELTKNVPEFITDYFTYINSNKTKLNNWSCIRQLLEWLIGTNIINNTLFNITQEELANVTDIHIIKYLDGLKLGLYGNKNTLSTINTKKNIISGFWAYLLDKDYVKKNIIGKKVHEKYIVKDKEVTVPTDEEFDDFLKNLETIKNETIAIRNITIVKTFMGSGIRLEELVGLDIQDLHFEDKNRPYITVMGKGIQDEEEKENVPINQTAVDFINNYLKIRSLMPNIESTSALFVSEQNDKMTGKRTRVAPSSIQQFFKIYSNNTIHPHMLRHYVGTKMYEKGNDIVGVSGQLRHKDINTTRKSYIKDNKDATYATLNSL